jgi:UDP:flavonoid glycosyltransferase YjiC (YdhE family)
MVCSGGADQAYWGAQVTRLKVGTATRLKGLNEATLTAGLREILTPEAGEHARLLAQHLIAPDVAVSRAVDILERSAAA